jgi:hypothetical protein
MEEEDVIAVGAKIRSKEQESEGGNPKSGASLEHGKSETNGNNSNYLIRPK